MRERESDIYIYIHIYIYIYIYIYRERERERERERAREREITRKHLGRVYCKKYNVLVVRRLDVRRWVEREVYNRREGPARERQKGRSQENRQYGILSY